LEEERGSGEGRDSRSPPGREGCEGQKTAWLGVRLGVVGREIQAGMIELEGTRMWTTSKGAVRRIPGVRHGRLKIPFTKVVGV
jgi:hypothetical protein